MGANQPSAWAQWNYSGYERKPDYPEYQAVIQMMAKVGADQGCGRAMWEYDPSLNRFGTTMSLMLLPVLDQRLRRLDGGPAVRVGLDHAVPLHQPERTVGHSRPTRWWAFPTAGLNVPLGIEHLQQLGVRYFLASSTTVEPAAAADPNLTQVASSGPWRTSYNGEALDTTWKVYRVKDSSLVAAAGQPAGGVERGVARPDQLVEPRRWPGTTTPAVERGARRRRPGGVGPGARRATPSRPRVPEPSTTVSDVVPDRQLDLLPRGPDRHPGRGQGLLLPELAGQRGRGPVAGGAQPDGGGPDQPRRDPPLRQLAPADQAGQLITLVAVAAVVALAVVDRGPRRRTAGPTAAGDPILTVVAA